VVNEVKEVCIGEGSDKKCQNANVPVRKITCGSKNTPVLWGINMLPTAELSIQGSISATGPIKSSGMTVNKPERMLGEDDEMSTDEFKKLVSGSTVDLGRVTIEMHNQVHLHKEKIARLEALIAKQTKVLSSMQSRILAMEKN